MKVFLEPSADVRMILDRRYQLKNSEKYSVRLCVRLHGKEFSLTENPRIQLSPEEWEKIASSHLRDKRLKLIRDELERRKQRAKEIIAYLGSSITYESFRKAYLNAFNYKEYAGIQMRKNALIPFFKSVIQEYKTNKQYSSSDIQVDALQSFLGFDRKMDFCKITPDYLGKYEDYMMNKGISSSTIGMYLSVLRRVLNLAIDEGLYSREYYPFGVGKNKYQLPDGRFKKQAVNMPVLAKILNYKPTIVSERWALDMWTFSFFSNGMNLKDVFFLKKKDIQGDFFSFYREKTKRTHKKNREAVSVYIIPVLRSIIEKWGNKRNGIYLFNVLSEYMTDLEKYEEYKKAVRRVNYNMRKICRRLNIEKLTSYSARHSWGTTLEREGVPISFIQQGYGHSSIATTERYLAGFTNDQQIKVANMLARLTFKTLKNK